MSTQRVTDNLSDRDLLHRIYDVSLETRAKVAELEGRLIGVDAKLNGFRFDLHRVRKEARKEVGSIRDSVSDLEEKVDDSGSHVLEEAKAKAAKLEEELKESRRYWVRWTVGIAVGVLVALVVALVSFTLGKKAGTHHVRSLDRVAQQP